MKNYNVKITMNFLEDDIEIEEDKKDESEKVKNHDHHV